MDIWMCVYIHTRQRKSSRVIVIWGWVRNELNMRRIAGSNAKNIYYIIYNTIVGDIYLPIFMILSVSGEYAIQS